MRKELKEIEKMLTDNGWDDDMVFYSLQLHSDDLKKVMAEVTEHLSMNGYTFVTNGEDTLFVYSEEVDYVETILEDRGIDYVETILGDRDISFEEYVFEEDLGRL